MEKNNSTTKGRRLTGVVVSDKMQKTRVVEISRLKKHPRYQKYQRVSMRFKAHDEQNQYKVGDAVVIEETRPLSRDKRWKIVELVKKAEEKSESPSSETEPTSE